MKVNFTMGSLFAMILGMLPLCVAAQSSDPETTARQYVAAHAGEWGLTPRDLDGMTVNDAYTDPATGIARVFFLQRHEGIPVYNAILNVNMKKDGSVFYVGKRFQPKLAERINTVQPVLSAAAAVGRLAEHLGLPVASLQQVARPDERSFVFGKGTLAREDVTAKLAYQPHGNAVLLVWDILLAPAGSHDKWSSRVDAVTGDVLDEYNWTIYCRVDGSAFRRQDHDCTDHETGTRERQQAALSQNGATYHVWPAPFESPNHGPRTFVTDPHDPVASPFGWHDTDGQEGAEFTITRGNNAHAYQDRDDNSFSQGDEPDGGPELLFDFPYESTWEPEEYIDAAVTNLFFWTNFIHDFSYHMGMTEVAGNFQQNNYGNGGNGNDPMIARAQAAANTGSANNAFYSHSPDGSSGSINMFIWQNSGSKFLKVDEPANIAGEYETVLPSAGNWGTGAYVSSTPVTGEVVIVADAVGSPTDGCNPLTNEADVQGRIALIDRGSCEFGSKAKRAQDAGAIGVIICNIAGVDPPGGMAPGADGGDVNIPVVMITLPKCDIIRQYAGAGLVITLVNPGQQVPASLDGDLDNGIIAHEYGHGVSIRLTGGPNASCLGNAEQMGEGWSDWIALVTSVQPGDVGAGVRGIGTYALRESTDGLGIRRYPYSTDMNINPLTYKDVAGNTGVHAIGEVWVGMLWDMYWAFVDQYGWSSDFYDPASGNNMATRLVYEGMKTQACNPGFVTGRDAILAADEALYDGAHECLLWEVFARRGLGEGADEGSTDSATDQVESFEVPCACRNAIRLTKSVTDFIEPGQDIDVAIRISNCKTDPVSGVTLTDEIPAGTQFKAGSANVPATVSGGVITFDIGALDFGAVTEVTYQLSSSPDLHSVRRWLDDVADATALDNWLFDSDPTGSADNIWTISDQFGGFTGDYAWYAASLPAESDVYLVADEDVAAWTVVGDRPTLRIYHRYNTEGGADGGSIEVKPVDATEWERVGNLILRNGYPGELQYGTLALPNVGAFSGNSGGEFEATYVDLSPWLGETVHLRFRYSSDANTTVTDGGWLIDDIEFMDLIQYNATACLSTAEGDQLCAKAPEEGTIVQSAEGENVATTEVLRNLSVRVYPNPASTSVQVALQSQYEQEVTVSLLAMDGRTVLTRQVGVFGNNHLTLPVQQLPAGIYAVTVRSAEGTIVSKVMVE